MTPQGFPPLSGSKSPHFSPPLVGCFTRNETEVCVTQIVFLRKHQGNVFQLDPKAVTGNRKGIIIILKEYVSSGRKYMALDLEKLESKS